MQDMVRWHLLDGIESGEYAVNKKLPTERELATSLGVSLAPVRGALDQLAQSGIVERKQGRGTLVRPRSEQRPLAAWGGITNGLREHGVLFETDVLIQTHAVPPADVARELQSSPGDAAFHLLRRFIVDGRPVASLDSWTRGIPVDAFADPEQFAHGESLYEELRKLRINPVPSTVSVQVAFCSERDTAIMEVSFGAAMLQVTSLATDGDRGPVEWSQAQYAPDLFSLNMSRDVPHP